MTINPPEWLTYLKPALAGEICDTLSRLGEFAEALDERFDTKSTIKVDFPSYDFAVRCQLTTILPESYFIEEAMKAYMDAQHYVEEATSTDGPIVVVVSFSGSVSPETKDFLYSIGAIRKETISLSYTDEAEVITCGV